MSVRETAKQLKIPLAKLEKCPSCGDKKLFSPPDEALNPVCKKTGKHICQECGDLQDTMKREYC